MQVLERPSSDEPDGVCGDTASSRLRHQPVADCRPALLEVDVVQRAAAEHDLIVVWLDQRKLDLLAARPSLFVPGEVGARVCLGARRPIGEALEQRVAEGQELRRHV
jgi:hypothetical protein